MSEKSAKKKSAILEFLFPMGIIIVVLTVFILFVSRQTTKPYQYCDRLPKYFIIDRSRCIHITDSCPVLRQLDIDKAAYSGIPVSQEFLLSSDYTDFCSQCVDPASAALIDSISHTALKRQRVLFKKHRYTSPYYNKLP